MRAISYYWIHPDDGMPQIDKTERSKESSEEKRRRFYVTDKRRKNMKNSNLFKKFATIVMAAMMVLSTFAMPTFAAGEDSQVIISGVEKGATVTLYKVVKEVNGTWVLEKDTVAVGEDIAETTPETGKTVVQVKGIRTTTITKNGQSIKTVEVIPSAAKISQIADNPAGLTSFKTYWDDADKTYKSYLADDENDDTIKKLEPGVYVAVVTGTSSDTIYNPMVVSIDYSPTNANNAVNAGHFFEDELGNKAYAKKSSPGMNKTTQDAEDRYDANDSRGDVSEANPFVGTAPNEFPNAVAEDRNAGTDFAGATVPYKVVATIPSYAETFTNPRFFFSDALQKGFVGYKTKPVVYEEDATQTSGYRTLTEGTDYWFVNINNGVIDKTPNTDTTSNKTADGYTNVGAKTFAIEFAVQNNKPARTVCIVYDAELVGTNHADYQAGLNPYTNEAKIEWSKNPSNEAEYGTDDDCTHHYTFDIDGNVGGSEVGKEIIKVGVDEAGNLVTSEQELKTNWTPLPNAKFAIFKANEDFTETVGNKLQEVTTEADGTMDFRGLDAGKYVIKETQAPEGYALNETLIPVEIVPSFVEYDHHEKKCNILESYKIIINKKYENTYTVTAFNEDGTVKTVSRDNNYKAEWKHGQRTTEVSNSLTEVGLTAGFVNTKTGTLPSTGGIGTVVFTVGGIAIMALALFLLFGAKKKEQE